ncbi:MAG: cytochrome c assembly protein [Dehalococcoidia bacterium]|nr:cytochrome c assembly protein [Dehalococcoidia bacterium]
MREYLGVSPRLGTPMATHEFPRLRHGLGTPRTFAWAALLAMPVAMYFALAFAPREATMGNVQRIFYIHVPAAWVAFLAFFVTFVASGVYLYRRQERWDILAVSSAEIGVLFTSLALVLGSLWAKPVWGAWWTWDPRLITTLFLWMVYVGYLMLRSAIEDPTQQARFAAVFGIVAFVDVPIVYFSIRWWRTIHPVVFTGGGLNLDTRMLVALLVGLAAMTFLYLALLSLRSAIEAVQRRNAVLLQELEEREEA